MSQVPVHNYCSLQMQVTVTDGEGRKFDNFSSLAFHWELSDGNLASLTDKSHVTMETVVLDSGRHVIKGEKKYIIVTACICMLSYWKDQYLICYIASDNVKMVVFIMKCVLQ